ncbi:GNAT family N-acetyltransferase [bacterium]|nr:GNAT family N-acetyltransferase [bacterium]
MLHVERLSESNRDSFFNLHCDRHEAGFCFCAAWDVESWDDWEERSAEENRAIREQLYTDGIYDGFLAFVDGEPDPVAWIQAAPRDSIPRLSRQFNLSQDSGAWAIGCLLIRPDWRGKGIARQMLTNVIDEISYSGASRIEAFPRSGEGHPAHELWNGPLALYLSLGFEVVQEGEPRCVVALEL